VLEAVSVDFTKDIREQGFGCGNRLLPWKTSMTAFAHIKALNFAVSHLVDVELFFRSRINRSAIWCGANFMRKPRFVRDHDTLIF
jgi:hypothetical protein